MKLTIKIILIFFTLNCYSQGWEVNTIDYGGEKYFYYPKTQNEKYVMMTSDLKWVWKIFKRGNYQTEKFPKDGLWIQLFTEDTTKVARIFEISDSLLTGNYEIYYFNGTLREKGRLDNGDKTGFWIFYHSNGQKEQEGEYYVKNLRHDYQTSKRIGIWKSWYSNGILKSQKQYDSLDYNTGLWTDYFENGVLKKTANYKANLLEGEYSEYAENGQILVSHNYEKGTISDSLSTFYYPNGQIEKQGQFKNNTEIGKWTYYFESGNLKSSGNFIDYKTTICVSALPRDCDFSTITDKWTIYYSDGNIKAKGNFKPIWKTVTRGQVKVSVETGSWIYYYPNGEVMASGDYEKEPKDIPFNKKKWTEKVAPKKVGNWIYYDRNGQETIDKNIIFEIEEYILKLKEELEDTIASR